MRSLPSLRGRNPVLERKRGIKGFSSSRGTNHCIDLEVCAGCSGRLPLRPRLDRRGSRDCLVKQRLSMSFLSFTKLLEFSG
jgi:hypothetical protein